MKKILLPSIPITDKRFQYTPAHETNIAKTFAKARAEMAKAKNVVPIRSTK